MSLLEEQAQLFERWKAAPGHEFFLADGVFDEEQWAAQPYKLLFVLKEANWSGANDDLCRALLSEKLPGYGRTWNNVARWAKALLEGGDYPRVVSKSDKSFWLRKVAALNLKKAGGGPVADDASIRRHARRDRAFLLEQIELYRPDFILCCGKGPGKNADILHDIVLPPEQVSPWQPPVAGYDYFLYGPGDGREVPVLSFYHPQLRCSHQVLAQRYEELKALGAAMRARSFRQL